MATPSGAALAGADDEEEGGVEQDRAELSARRRASSCGVTYRREELASKQEDPRSPIADTGGRQPLLTRGCAQCATQRQWRCIATPAARPVVGWLQSRGIRARVTVRARSRSPAPESNIRFTIRARSARERAHHYVSTGADMRRCRGSRLQADFWSFAQLEIGCSQGSDVDDVFMAPTWVWTWIQGPKPILPSSAGSAR